MLRGRFLPLLQNDSPVFANALLSSFHTSQNVYKKCRKEKDRSCEPIPVAVILCGCGALDGTEISEAISATIHICQKDMRPIFYAPDMDLCEVIDHCTKEVDMKSSPRNALVEAARLARSNIRPICECEACMHGALVLPGGFGAAKTLSDFAEKGADCSIIPELEKIIEDFHCEKKPIASMCIASVLVARVLKGVKITLGKESPNEDWPYGEAIQKARDMGAKVELKNVKGVTRDKKYNVYSTPAWMNATASIVDVHSGIGKLINMMKKNVHQ